MPRLWGLSVPDVQTKFSAPDRTLWEFLDELDVRAVRGQEYKFVLLSPFSWTDGCHVVTVHDGFPTDFASIPRSLWSLYPPDGAYLHAAVIHDWMYVEGYKTKAYADYVFYGNMLNLGVDRDKARKMYLAVREFGGGNYPPDQFSFLYSLIN